MAGSGLGTILLLGVAGIGAAGFAKVLPPGLQTQFNQIVGSISAVSGQPTPTGSVPTAADIAAWSQGINLPTWVGTLYVADNGKLPDSIASLTTWGANKSYYVNGKWIPPAGVS